MDFGENSIYCRRSATECVFVVGAEKVEMAAPRLLVCLSSSVFCNYFNSQPATVMTLSDEKPHIFQKLLLFIQQGTEFESVEEAMTVGEVAHKFRVYDLVKHCGQYLRPRNVNTLWRALNFATRYNIRSLATEAMDIVKKNTKDVLTNDGLLTLHAASMELILRQEKFNLDSEIPLFEAVLRWSEARCKEENLEPSFENMMLQLEKSNLLRPLRSLIIQPAELMSRPARSGLFISEEVSRMLKTLSPTKYTIVKSHLDRASKLKKRKKDERITLFVQNYVRPCDYSYANVAYNYEISRTNSFLDKKVKQSNRVRNSVSGQVLSVTEISSVLEYFSVTCSEPLLITSITLAAQIQSSGKTRIQPLGTNQLQTYEEDISIEVRRLCWQGSSWDHVGTGHCLQNIVYGGSIVIKLKIDEESDYVEICSKGDKICVQLTFRKLGEYPLYYSTENKTIIQANKLKGIIMEVGFA